MSILQKLHTRAHTHWQLVMLLKCKTHVPRSSSKQYLKPKKLTKNTICKGFFKFLWHTQNIFELFWARGIKYACFFRIAPQFLVCTKYFQLQVSAMACIHILFQTFPPTNVRNIKFQASHLETIYLTFNKHRN
jgi:hypothetical protein